MLFILLVFLTFLAGAFVDYMMRRGKATAPVLEIAVLDVPKPAFVPAYVEGFLVPEGLRYHPGHTWVQRERCNTVRVGVDEFAAKLAGNIEKIELPKPGQWFRQGQPVFKVHRNGESATLLSPVEGEVVEVNAEILNNPSLVRQDPYASGWLMTLHVYDETGTWRNLLPANLVKHWTKEAVTRLYAKQPSMVGAVAADGGRPVDDLLAALPGANWRAITSEFFLA